MKKVSVSIVLASAMSIMPSVVNAEIGSAPPAPGVISLENVDLPFSWGAKDHPATKPCGIVQRSGDSTDTLGQPFHQIDSTCSVGGPGGPFYYVKALRVVYGIGAEAARHSVDKAIAAAKTIVPGGPSPFAQAGENTVRQEVIDFTLKSRALGGNVIFYESNGRCFWQFLGVDRGTVVALAVNLPKVSCPKYSSLVVTPVVARFFQSISLDGVE